MGAPTKAELDQVAAELREDCAVRGHPVAPVTKSVPNAALVEAIVTGIAPFIYDLEKQIATLSSRNAFTNIVRWRTNCSRPRWSN